MIRSADHPHDDTDGDVKETEPENDEAPSGMDRRGLRGAGVPSTGIIRSSEPPDTIRAAANLKFGSPVGDWGQFRAPHVQALVRATEKRQGTGSTFLRRIRSGRVSSTCRDRCRDRTASLVAAGDAVRSPPGLPVRRSGGDLSDSTPGHERLHPWSRAAPPLVTSGSTPGHERLRNLTDSRSVTSRPEAGREPLRGGSSGLGGKHGAHGGGHGGHGGDGARDDERAGRSALGGFRSADGPTAGSRSVCRPRSRAAAPKPRSSRHRRSPRPRPLRDLRGNLRALRVSSGRIQRFGPERVGRREEHEGGPFHLEPVRTSTGTGSLRNSPESAGSGHTTGRSASRGPDRLCGPLRPRR